MFKFLKEKIKSWVSKAKEPEEAPKKTKKVKVKAPKEKKLEKEIEKAKKKVEEVIEKEKEEVKERKQVEEEIKEKEQVEESLQPEEEPQEKKSFFSAFKKKLTNEKFEELFQELELILLQNNVAIEVVDKIRLTLQEQLIGKNLSTVNLEEKLKQALESVLIDSPDFLKEIKTTLATKKPFVILFIGINGSGKTTTIAKVANLLKKEKYSICLAAADTFRAASIEQLQKHADNLQVPLIKKDYGADPASIGFDAIQYAKKHHIDIVLIDTAGRMQNKDSLMREMEKIERVNKPDLRIFVGESITGNDATEQARSFNESIALDGIVLSKADVDEKGGTAISVSYVTKKPILFLGTGQTYDDLEVFDKEKVLKNLGFD